MEEMKMLVDIFSKLGDSAQTAFCVWCVKEVIVYTITPISLLILGRICISLQENYFKWREKQERAYNRNGIMVYEEE